MALEGVTFNCSWWNSYLVYDILYHFRLCELALFVKFEVITVIYFFVLLGSNTVLSFRWLPTFRRVTSLFQGCFVIRFAL
jgi:hypothetical protein